MIQDTGYRILVERSNMSNYKKLDVWRMSHELVLDIYKITVSFPKDELYSLTSQIRRASYSIPANIAEGYGRAHRKELLQFLNIAKGSASELEYELMLARDLGYLSNEEYSKLDASVKTIIKMLTGLSRSLRTQPII